MSGLVECHELWPKISKTTGIVSRIAEYTNSTVGIGLQCLPTAAQMGECYYVAEALLEGFWSDVEAYLAQLMNSCDDGVGVAWLAIATQWTLEGAVMGCFVYIIECVMSNPRYLRTVAGKVEHRCLSELGILFEGEAYAFVFAFADDTWYALFHNAGFLGCNLWQRITEELGMVE